MWNKNPGCFVCDGWTPRTSTDGAGAPVLVSGNQAQTIRPPLLGATTSSVFYSNARSPFFHPRKIKAKSFTICGSLGRALRASWKVLRLV